ncbi:MAG: YbaK/EbsC family protein [Conexivisphaerales archaeon]
MTSGEGSGNPKRIIEWMRSRGIKGDIIRIGDAATSSTAADSLGLPVNKIVKSVLFVDDKGKPVLAILGGENKVIQTEFARMIGRKKVRLATREEVLKFTGYPAGGVPPLALQDGLEIYVDKKIGTKGEVNAGGGTEEHILRINAAELLKLYKERLIDLPVKPL